MLIPRSRSFYILVKHTKLEFGLINSFVTNLTFSNSLLHYLATLRYFCTSIVQLYISYKTIKVCLAGIHVEHLEKGFHDPTNDELLQLLCTRIKCSQGTTTCTHLPITTDQLHSLKTQLHNDASYSLLEKDCCGQYLH